MTRLTSLTPFLALAAFVGIITGCTDAPTDATAVRARHFTGYTETDMSHKFIISTMKFVEGHEQLLVPSGWEAAVFTFDGVLAGSVVWSDSGENVLKAWGANDLVEQFHADEKFDFRVWDNQTDKEYYADASFTKGPTVWKANGLSEIAVYGFVAREMTVPLESGWNLISINVKPNQVYYNDNGPDIRKMMRQFSYDGRSHLILMKNERGNFYSPANRDFNNIPYWNVSEGYLVRVDGAMSGHWIGHVIEADQHIEIAAGWNMIAYNPTYPLSCDSGSFKAFSSIKSYVTLAKDGNGNFASPAYNFSNMPPWREGRGYQIDVTTNVGLHYEDPETPAPRLTNEAADTVFGPWRKPARTSGNMSVLITGITNVVLHDSDAVAAFSTRGRLVGVNRPTGGRIGLAVWGDDQTTEAVDGLQNGEAFSLRYWSSADNTLHDLQLGVQISGEGLVYETDGFTVGSMSFAP